MPPDGRQLRELRVTGALDENKECRDPRRGAAVHAGHPDILHGCCMVRQPSAALAALPPGAAAILGSGTLYLDAGNSAFSTNLWRIDLPSGQAAQLTHNPGQDGISNFSASPRRTGHGRRGQHCRCPGPALATAMPSRSATAAAMTPRSTARRADRLRTRSSRLGRRLSTGSCCGTVSSHRPARSSMKPNSKISAFPDGPLTAKNSSSGSHRTMRHIHQQIRHIREACRHHHCGAGRLAAH